MLSNTSSNDTIINRIEEFRHILRVREYTTKNKSNIAISNRQNQQYHLVLAELKKKFENKQSRLLLRDANQLGDAEQRGKSDSNDNICIFKHQQHAHVLVELRKKFEHKQLHDDELFKQPPPNEDCPICMDRLPTLDSGSVYMTCCGKLVCSGCDFAPLYDHHGNKVAKKGCPFCRAPRPLNEKEMINRYKKRMELDDPMAIHSLGGFYLYEMFGLARDYTKALELYHRAAELGYAKAYTSIGYAYATGKGVEVDNKKARYYYELAAMGGDASARYNLGVIEKNVGNTNRALKHFLIAVRDGDDDSLKQIKRLYSDGHATRRNHTEALRLYQEYLNEIRNIQRDEAAAANDKYRYYNYGTIWGKYIKNYEMGRGGFVDS